MKSLFIFGNGFDIAHGLQSQYSNFRKFLVERYPDIEEYCDREFAFSVNDDLTLEEFSLEILLDAMNQIIGNDWNNFEEALGRMSFHNKFPVRSQHEIEKNVKEDIINHLYLISFISNIIIESTDVWQIFFNDWISNIEENLYNNSIKVIPTLTELFKNNDENIYLNFNYTNTLQHLYGIKNVTHIHNKVGEKLIFGHGKKDAVYSSPVFKGSVMSSSLDDLLMCFHKNTDLVLFKNKNFFNELSNDIDKVYSYGFSYSSVDTPYIKKIIKKISPNAVWYFTRFEENNSQLIKEKKCKLRQYGFKGKFDVFEG